MGGGGDGKAWRREHPGTRTPRVEAGRGGWSWWWRRPMGVRRPEVDSDSGVAGLWAERSVTWAGMLGGAGTAGAGGQRARCGGGSSARSRTAARRFIRSFINRCGAQWRSLFGTALLRRAGQCRLQRARRVRGAGFIAPTPRAHVRGPFRTPRRGARSSGRLARHHPVAACGAGRPCGG